MSVKSVDEVVDKERQEKNLITLAMLLLKIFPL